MRLIFTLAGVLLLVKLYPPLPEAYSPARHSEQQFEAAGNNYKTAAVDQNDSKELSPRINIRAGFLSEYAKYCTTKSHDQEEEWLRQSSCEVKLTDAIIPIFTVVLVFGTFLLVVVGIIQRRQLSKTVLLAREEFLSGHRPKIIIRRMDLGEKKPTQTIEDFPITPIILSIANVGQTVADVTTIGVGVSVTEDIDKEALPEMKLDDVSEFKGQYWRLRPGQTRQWHAVPRSWMNGDKVTAIEDGKMALICVAKVSYKDGLGFEREISAYRR